MVIISAACGKVHFMPLFEVSHCLDCRGDPCGRLKGEGKPRPYDFTQPGLSQASRFAYLVKTLHIEATGKRLNMLT